MQPTEKNARFWTYVNGWVKITLRPGEMLHHSWGKPTDEGWHRESNTWTHDGDCVCEAWCSDGVDCDGRLTQSGDRFALIGDLRCDLFVEEDGTIYPRPIWQEGERSQRDYSAEAAGY